MSEGEGYGYGVRRTELLPAIVVCFCLFAAGIVLIFEGCAVRHLPGGGTAPATRFEQVLAWNAALAQANDGFADNVIALQRGGVIEMEYAKAVLLKQAAIAKADRDITNQISAAALCATDQLGKNAVPSELDAAGVTCAQVSSSALATEVQLITDTLTDLDKNLLLGVKNQDKRKALDAFVVTIGETITNIASALKQGGVIH